MQHTLLFRLVLAVATAALLHCAPLFAQQNGFATDMHVGMHFEVAFGVVWPDAAERPFPTSHTLVITSRVSGDVVVQMGPRDARTSKTYKLDAGVAKIVVVQTALALPSTQGGSGPASITLISTVPISVATDQAYKGNRNVTLHYPVGTWGTKYHAFSYWQDRYGAGANYKYRPGQIVIIASEDSTTVTINPSWKIAANATIGAIILLNKPRSVVLHARETLVLLGHIDQFQNREWSSDLTGTSIVSTKPIAVLSGHTKGAVQLWWDILPPTGMFATEAYFIRNNFYQSLLPDYLADTAFVTVPMLYTSVRNRDKADVVRVLALQNNTVVRRTRAFGGGSVAAVDTLQAGQTFVDLEADTAYRWTTSKPAMMMQYGRSFTDVPPLEANPTGRESKEVEQVQYPTVTSGLPTMMLVPGENRWIQRASFVSPDGLDNFISVVMRKSDTSSLLIDGSAPDTLSWQPITGTNCAYIRTPMGAGTHNVATTTTNTTFMAWSYGSLDGLAFGGSYGHPIGVNVASACNDELAAYADRFERYTRATARILPGSDCSSWLRYEVLSSNNASIDSVSLRPDSLRADSISIYALQTNTDSAGAMTVRFTSTSGRFVDIELVLSPLPRRRNNVLLEIAAAKRLDTLVASIILDSAIDSRFTQCYVYLRYDARSLDLLTPPYRDSVDGPIHTSGFLFPIVNHAAGTLLGKVEFVVYYTPLPAIHPTIPNVSWYEGATRSPYVNTFVRTVIIDTIPDTTQVDVDDEAPASAGYTGPTLALSPQPAHDIVSITYRIGGYNMGLEGGALRAVSDPYTLRVYDYTGTVVMDLSDKLVGEEGTIVVNTNSLTSGMYVLQMSDAQGEHRTYVRAWLLK